MALTDNLVAYYKLDETSGNAADSVGSNTLTATSTTWTTGKINNGWVASASGGKLLSTTSPLTGSGDWTFNCWINPNSTGTNINVVDFGDSSQVSKSIMFIYRLGSDDKIHVDTAGAGLITSGSTYNSNAWYMLTLTKSGNNFALYMNNSADGTGTTTGVTLGSNLLSIGYDNPNSRWSWTTGGIDEVGFWTRVLSGAEITQLYNSGAGLAYPMTTASASTSTGLLLKIG